MSDIAAMGGRPWAVVDVLFLGNGHHERVLDGLRAASAAFGVRIVGGHTTRVEGPSSLAVAIVGQAKQLIESHTARPGQALLAAIDLRGASAVAARSTPPRPCHPSGCGHTRALGRALRGGARALGQGHRQRRRLWHARHAARVFGPGSPWSA